MRSLTCLLVAAFGALPAHASTITASDADYGSYVQGHLALADGELERAASYFAGALSYTPDDPELLRQTFELAIAAGDEPLAVRTGQRLALQDRFDSGVTMLLAATAIKEKRWKDAEAETLRLGEAGFGSFIVPILQAWMADARGKHDRAVNLLDASTLEGFAKSYVLEHRAHLLFRDRRFAEAAAIYDELATGDEGRNTRIRVAAAAAWQAAKQREEAAKRLAGAGSHPEVDAARAALAAGKPIAGVPNSASAGIALLALRMSADLSRERPVPVALTMARIATFLEPGDATAWLMTSELLARLERYDSALVAVHKVPGDSPSASLARGQEAAILSRLEREPEALQLLENAVHAASATAEDWGRFADALQQASRFDEAAKAYARAIELSPADDPTTWRVHFLYGSALEQGGNWPDAEKALRRAAAMQPGDASLLNYLGYALLDRGLAKQEARGLIEKAHALAPEDGFITDSLGWAQFQAGEYAAAVKTLERAASSVPDDPVIAEHLGDAYWRVGRRIEARHRWKAALDSSPKPEQAKQLRVKHDFGLDVALAEARRSPANP